MRIPAHWPLTLGSFTLGLLIGLLGGFLLPVPTPHNKPATAGQESGGVLVIRIDPSLGAVAEFTGSMQSPDDFRHVYTFARQGDAQRAGEAAKAALSAEFRRALDGR